MGRSVRNSSGREVTNIAHGQHGPGNTSAGKFIGNSICGPGGKAEIDFDERTGRGYDAVTGKPLDIWLDNE